MAEHKKKERKKPIPFSEAPHALSLEKKTRATELELAVKELAYQNDQKEQRAQELAIANKELAYQNEQKEQRAQELLIANKELAYQNDQKEKRAAELELANIELAYEAEQKEQRARELAVANIELAYQNEQKEKRAADLASAIKDLEAFAYVSSHHLQEPLRKIRSFVDRVLERDAENLSDKGRHNLARIDVSTARMSQLIQDVYTYSRINVDEPVFERVHVASLIERVVAEFAERIAETQAQVSVDAPIEASVIPAQFRQAVRQLLDNALKFVRPGTPPQIVIAGGVANGAALNYEGLNANGLYCWLTFTDNGPGFDPAFNESIFGIFQKLHPVEDYPGTGIGLAIVKKIMNRHGGVVRAEGREGEGARFWVYVPEGHELCCK